MTNIRIVFLLALLPILTSTSGMFELLIYTPRTIVIEETVCSQFECPTRDETAQARKAVPETPLKITTAPYPHDSKTVIDVHLRIFEPVLQEYVATWHNKLIADTDFQEFSISTTANFNVTMKIRNLCNPNYFTKTCGTICVETETFRCTEDGRRVCKDGWSGPACSYPICEGNCSNGRGVCVAPGVCECRRGFSGAKCEKCETRPGCVNGDCERGVIPNTCVCRPGFVGRKCDIDIGMCTESRNPCKNQGNCSLDHSSPRGFKCRCPFGFIGDRCETAIEDVRCSADQKKKLVCLNGGECISSSLFPTQCTCPPGFVGILCELGGLRHSSCATLTCAGSSKCVELQSGPACVGNVVSTSTEFPNIILLNGWNGMNTAQVGSDDLLQSGNVIALFSLIIVGLCVAICIGVVKFIRPRGRRAADSFPLPTTCSSQSSPSSSSSMSPPAYKVCIIDAATGVTTNSLVSPHSSASADCSSSCSDPNDPSSSSSLRPHSPPPAYSSLAIPRAYKSVPTKCPSPEDEPPFRDDDNVV